MTLIANEVKRASYLSLTLKLIVIIPSSIIKTIKNINYTRKVDDITRG
jgi:hypothetical protein